MSDVNKEIALKVTTDTTQTQKAFKNAQQELEETRKLLIDMALAGKQGTKEFIELEKRAGAIQDALGDVGARVNALASDTPKLDLLTKAAEGIAGGFAIAQGAAALFGDENEEVQQAILKTQAAMSLLNGVQAVANSLNKDSVLRVQAAALAQSTYATVVGTTTGALKLFRIALASTGVGLVIVAIGALVANFDKVKTAISNFIESAAPLKAVVDFLTNSFTRLGRAIGIIPSETAKATKQMIADLENQKKILEAAGADTAAIDLRLAELRVKLAKETGEELAQAEQDLTLEKAKQFKAQADKAAEAEAKRVEAAKQARLKRESELKKERDDFAKFVEEMNQLMFDMEFARRNGAQTTFDSLEALGMTQMQTEAKRRMESAQADIAAAKLRADNEAMFAQARLQVNSSLFGSLSQLAASFAAGQGKNAERAFKLSKTLGIAQAVIDTYVGASSAFAQTPGGVVIKSLAAAASIAAGLARVNAIRQQQFNAPQVNVTTAPIQIPQLNGNISAPQGTNANQIQTTDLTRFGQQGQPQGQRVFVLERDITQTQDRLGRVREFATL